MPNGPAPPSQQQYNYAKEIIEHGNWGNRATLLQEDYRNLQGSYDRIVSIEMIEAVGHEYLPTYFSKISDLLATDGATHSGNYHAGPSLQTSISKRSIISVPGYFLAVVCPRFRLWFRR